MTTTFEENKPKEVNLTFDLNNQCKACGRRAGKYATTQPGVFAGIYLINDSRGFKICSNCAAEGKLIRKQKLNKKDKKKFKEFKRGMKQMQKIPHITLDAEGKKVE